ncbi:hypothetical protein LTR92_011594 [Exophiala xenobiotica]|nr:hypothetical protein LTR92_011594 [Exophiala xenobiotica]KAK5353014.1 hypothetical protein LTR11_011959 [Exophiala xenobiotica]KAK5431444.1 hypothetical protein LTR18_011358 [Exophiala xenobiotica]
MTTPPENDTMLRALATQLRYLPADVEKAFHPAPQNVRMVLRRQYFHTVDPKPERPVCKLHSGFAALTVLSLELALFTLARLYPDLKQPQNDNVPMEAVWKPAVPITFHHLPKLQSLSSLLPGEQASSHRYAGVGGGGGSDVISARTPVTKAWKKMDVLMSTRTWATGSQGKRGAKLGVKREVYNHDGPALSADGRPVTGTFRVASNTYTEGGDLEAVLVRHHEMIYLVLDQAESKSDIPQVVTSSSPRSHDFLRDLVQPCHCSKSA